MNKDEVTVGMTLLGVGGGNLARRGQGKPREFTVVRIGRQYFYIRPSESLDKEHLEWAVPFGSAHTKSEANSFYLLFKTSEELEDARYVDDARHRLRRYFDSRMGEITLGATEYRKIEEIIKEKDSKYGAD